MSLQEFKVTYYIAWLHTIPFLQKSLNLMHFTMFTYYIALYYCSTHYVVAHLAEYTFLNKINDQKRHIPLLTLYWQC